jgi:DNA repair protein RecN (Recombination protein N)
MPSIRSPARTHPRTDESARILIQEIADALRDYSARIEADPGELERLQSRLAELERLQRKYGPDLLSHLNRVQAEMDSIGLTESRKDELEAKITGLFEEYRKAAEALRRKRHTASKTLEDRVVRELKSLAMPNTRFEVHWSDVTGTRPGDRSSGTSNSANPEEPRLWTGSPGGELSRIMLALRTVMTVRIGFRRPRVRRSRCRHRGRPPKPWEESSRNLPFDTRCFA